jgi:hypothetical protein
MPLLRERRPDSKFHQAAGSPMPEVFQKTLQLGRTGEEGEGQEVAAHVTGYSSRWLRSRVRLRF